MLLKHGNLVCAYADFAKFIYEILDICSQQKNKTKKQNTYMSRKIRIS